MGGEVVGMQPVRVGLGEPGTDLGQLSDQCGNTVAMTRLNVQSEAISIGQQQLPT